MLLGLSFHAGLGQEQVIHVESFGPAEGFSGSFITCMFEDHLGLIWIGTRSGVVKYDGFQMTSYQYREASDSILGIVADKFFVNDIIEDHFGNLWLSTFYNNYPGSPTLLCYDRKMDRLVPYQPFQKLEENIAPSLFPLEIDSQHYFWFSNREAVFRVPLKDPVPDFDANSIEIIKPGEKGLPDGVAEDFFLDSQQRLWLASHSGLSRWVDTTQTFKTYRHTEEPEFSRDLFYYEIAEGTDGKLWVSTRGGQVLSFDPVTEKFSLHYQNRGQSFDLAVDDRQGLWFSRPQGLGELFYLDPKSGNTTKLKVLDWDLEPIALLKLDELLFDSRGNLWLGGKTDGMLYKYNAQKNAFGWISPEKYRSGPAQQLGLVSLLQTGENDFWFGVHDKGLIHWDPAEDLWETVPLNPPEQAEGQPWRINDLALDHNGKIWIAFQNAYLANYDPSTGEQHYLSAGTVNPKGQGFRPVLKILADQSGFLWLGRVDGVFRLDPDSGELLPLGISNPAEMPEMPAYPVTDMLKDRDGNLWIATSLTVLFKFDPTRTELMRFPTDSGNKCFLEGRDGSIWVGLEGDGLLKLDRHTLSYKQYRQKDGLANNSVQSILEDADGRLWLGTKNGLSVFDPVKESFRNFTKADGMVGEWFTSPSHSTPDGHLFFGNREGLLWFHPDSIRIDSTPPKMIFTGIDLFGEPLPIEESSPLYQHPSVIKKLVLDHWQNDLTFHFAALHYKNPAGNQYEIWLEPYEAGWRNIHTQRQMSYPRLAPGHYTLHLKAANSDGVWSEDEISMDIFIRPPWYWNFWSGMVYLLLAIGIVVGISRFQINRRLALAEAQRLRELDVMKTQLYTNITHEFRTPLTVILGVTEQMSASEAKKEIIRRNSQNLLDLINRMLDLSKIEAGKLEPQNIQGDILTNLNYLTESFHSLALSQKINLSFLANEKELIMDYDPEMVLRIFSNLISNAIKFTPEYGKVSITALKKRKDNDLELHIQVKDTGIGIEAEHLPYIFDRFHQVDPSHTRKREGTGIGLALTRELVKAMKGNILVKSRPGEGSVFTVILPITNQAPLIAQEETKSVILQEREVGNEVEEDLFNPAERGATTNGQRSNRLLIIEDNREVMQFIASCLSSGYELIFGRNGREGIELALEHIPDIIISDVMMPEVDGFELCKTLKQHELTSHIPIILLTAKADTPSRLEGLTYGADAYLVKPFHREELEIRIRKLIELRRRLQEKFQTGITEGEDNAFGEDPFLSKVRQAILDHLDEHEFGSIQLSEALRLHRSQVHRKLKALTDLSTSIFIRQVRLQEGYRLLEQGELNVSEVAYAVGFSDPNFFSRVFAQQYRVPPSKVQAGGQAK